MSKTRINICLICLDYNPTTKLIGAYKKKLYELKKKALYLGELKLYLNYFI